MQLKTVGLIGAGVAVAGGLAWAVAHRVQNMPIETYQREIWGRHNKDADDVIVLAPPPAGAPTGSDERFAHAKFKESWSNVQPDARVDVRRLPILASADRDGDLRVTYRELVAEVARIDTNSDDNLTSAERSAYFARFGDVPRLVHYEHLADALAGYRAIAAGD